MSTSYIFTFQCEAKREAIACGKRAASIAGKTKGASHICHQIIRILKVSLMKMINLSPFISKERFETPEEGLYSLHRTNFP
jgi:hypothetical protein